MGTGREKIRGRETVNLIEQVWKNKPLVNMRLSAHDFEILTVIDGIETSKKGRVFAVDVPVDLKEGFDAMDHWSVEFQFTDANRVPCRFTTFSAGIWDDKMWILFPEVIYREQKREHFRVEAPLKASFCLKKDETQYMLNVSNISMGGLLVTVRTGPGYPQILHVGERLKDTEIVLASGSVHIKEAVVRWTDKGALASTIQFGIQFTGMHQEERRFLREIVYELQRAFLARRAGTA
ncbi:MAG: PilZ domain-containing protein [Desulfatiglandaceae bacterium]